MTVKVQERETSRVITHDEVKNAYQKGLMYCVYCIDGWTHKYPIDHIFRVLESPFDRVIDKVSK